jgi:hypothetical protein
MAIALSANQNYVPGAWRARGRSIHAMGYEQITGQAVITHATAQFL